MVIRLRRGDVCAAIVVPLLSAAAPPGHAAGFSIFEQGARGMGFAGAFVAVANDPSAIFHNAGGIGFLKGKNLYLGGTLASPSFEVRSMPSSNRSRSASCWSRSFSISLIIRQSSV